MFWNKNNRWRHTFWKSFLRILLHLVEWAACSVCQTEGSSRHWPDCVGLFGDVLHVKVWQNWHKKYTSHCVEIENGSCSLERQSFSKKPPAAVRSPSRRVKRVSSQTQFTDCFGNIVPRGIWCQNELCYKHTCRIWPFFYFSDILYPFYTSIVMDTLS